MAAEGLRVRGLLRRLLWMEPECGRHGGTVAGQRRTDGSSARLSTYIGRRVHNPVVPARGDSMQALAERAPDMGDHFRAFLL
jgi:hypothetical protein